MFPWLKGTVDEKKLQQIPLSLGKFNLQVLCKISPHLGCTTYISPKESWAGSTPSVGKYAQKQVVHPIQDGILHETNIRSISRLSGIYCEILIFFVNSPLNSVLSSAYEETENEEIYNIYINKIKQYIRLKHTKDSKHEGISYPCDLCDKVL